MKHAWFNDNPHEKDEPDLYVRKVEHYREPTHFNTVYRCVLEIRDEDEILYLATSISDAAMKMGKWAVEILLDAAIQDEITKRLDLPRKQWKWGGSYAKDGDI